MRLRKKPPAPTPPTAGGRRRLPVDTGFDLPAQTAKPRTDLLRVAVITWVVLWVAGTAAAATVLIDRDVPGIVPDIGAGLLTVLFMVGLTHRTGGRVWLWSGFTLVGVVAAFVLDYAWVTPAMAVVCAATAAVFAVMITRPAETWWKATGEVVLAAVVAESGALGVAAYEADVVGQRFLLVVVGLALIVMIGVGWGLGAGLHGLGRRGLLLILGGGALVTVVLVYAVVLRTYGSPAIVDTVNAAIDGTRDFSGGVPRPTEVFIGFPALLWGVSTRARRRQGWWMCAFGVFATATVTSSLVSPEAETGYVLLSTAYSLVLGLLIGLVVRRIDQIFTRGSGRRSLRDTKVSDLRPEARRTAPLK